MKKSTRILAFSLLCLAPPFSWAQLYHPNEAGVSFASVHTIVRDVAASQKFWAIFGGKPTKIEGVDVVELPGALIFLHPGEPTGPTKGHQLDHIGINCEDCFPVMKRLVEGGYKSDRIDPKTLRGVNWTPKSVNRAFTYAYSPDGVRIEISTNPCTFRSTFPFLGPSRPDLEPCPEGITEGPRTTDPAGLIGFDHVHFFMKSIVDSKPLYVFYMKYFGGRQLKYPNVNVSVPGAVIYTALAEESVERGGSGDAIGLNKGGALDSIGFEVKNLEAFSKRLQADGVQVIRPYSKTRYKTFAHAEFADPRGTQFQLTEGLNRFVSKAPRVASQEPRTAAATGAAHGKQVYEGYCSYCHAAASTTSQYGGAPGLKGFYSWPAHKLSDGTEHKEHTDAQIRQLIVLGNQRTGGGMRPVGYFLSNPDMDDLIAYLRTL